MIFKSIDNITSRKEISFFIEKIVLYTKIVKLIASRNSMPIDNKSFAEINKSIINELISIGVISKSNDTSILQKRLGNDLYNEFIISVNFRLKYKNKIGVSLDKLSNFERNKLQQKASKSKDPRLIDFFCGAGGLSLGFVQEGFQIDLANDHEEVCIETYKYNHPEIPENGIIHGDIRKIVNQLDD